MDVVLGKVRVGPVTVSSEAADELVAYVLVPHENSLIAMNAHPRPELEYGRARASELGCAKHMNVGAIGRRCVAELHQSARHGCSIGQDGRSHRHDGSRRHGCFRNRAVSNR